MVKERPILMSAPMVKALLDGRKTQTRRIIKPQPEVNEHGNLSGEWLNKPLDGLLLPKLKDIVIHCPYGERGDRLWVRETCVIAPQDWNDGSFSNAIDSENKRRLIQYIATDPSPDAADDYGLKKTPSIFMPRWASRITLEITNIRVERLQDISDEDAISEGVDRTNTSISGYASERYKRLWESINGKGSWDANPYVWRIEFRRM
jgi:hypothetical protein